MEEDQKGEEEKNWAQVTIKLWMGSVSLKIAVGLHGLKVKSGDPGQMLHG